MRIAKGRDSRVACVEDDVTDLEITIYQSLQLLYKEIDIVTEECRLKARQYGEGDIIVEQDVYKSALQYSSVGVLLEHINYLLGANFCFIYSFLEKKLKSIISDYKIDCPRKSDSCSDTYHFVRSIRLFLDLESFSAETEEIFKKIDEEYRKVRIHLIHGECKDIKTLQNTLEGNADITIYDNEIFFNNDNYITSFMSCVKLFLVEIVNLVDQKQSDN